MASLQSTTVNGYVLYASSTVGCAAYDVTAGTNGTVKWTLRRTDGTVVTTNQSGFIYRVKIVTMGTGTDTGTLFLAQNIDGAGWTVRTVYRDGTGSNHPYLFVDSDGLPKVTIDHPSNYTLRVVVEEVNGANSGATQGVFGSDAIIGFDGAGVTKIFPGSTLLFGSNTVLHSGNYTSYSPSLTGSGASGTWGISITGNADTVDGYHLNQDVRTSGAPSFQYIGVNPSGASNNGYGISLYGGASAAPTYGIFFQGTGTYGTHGSVTGDWATYFTMNNDNTRGWIWRKTANGNVASLSAGGVLQVDGDMRAPIFYDSANTSYYVDPNSTSRMVSIWLSTGGFSGNLYIGGDSPGGRLNINADQIWTATGNLYLQYSSSGWVYLNDGGGHTQSATSMRAPIFYDSNDTGYYLDPNSFSNLSTVRVQSLNSPNGDTVVAADSAMPAYKSSFIHTLGLGPGGNDGHILGMTWTNASIYGAQIWIDTDPNDIMAIRSRSSGGVWTSWKTVLHSGNYNSYSPTLTGGGASGTWSINITGSAGSATSAGSVTHNASRTDATWYNVGWFSGNPSPAYSCDSVQILSSTGSIRANVYYDNQNTSYYGDFAGTSNMYRLQLGGGAGGSYAGLTVQAVSGNTGPIVAKSSNYATVWSILPWSAGDTYMSTGIYYENGNWVHASSDTTNALFRFRPTGPTWYSSNNSTGSWNVATDAPLWDSVARWINNVTAPNDVRAPIFYDSQNTAYYLDPASTSNLNGLTVGGSSVVTNNGGTWGISISGNAATVTNGVYTTGSYANPAWITSLAWSKITGAPAFITGNQTITLSGDATGSGTTAITVTLANSGVTAATYGGNNSIPSLVIDAKGRVTSASTVTPSGTWAISISGTAATATSSTTQDGGNNSTLIATTAFVKRLLGAETTSGTLDWNDVSNTRPGTGYSLLLGSATNGFGGGSYYHAFNLEYASKDGTGNVTQLAIAYGSPGNDIKMRGRYSGSWSGWITFLNSGNYNSYSPTLTGTGASGTWSINITGSAGSASTASQVTINYNNDSNSTYQMLWGSGNSVYGTAGVYVNPSSDYVYANSFNASDWFRSSGNSGWYNSTYAVGIYATDSTWVRTYNNAQFYSSTIIEAGGSVRAPIFYDSQDTTYYLDPNSTSVMKGIDVRVGSVIQFYTSAGSLRGYINATDTDDNHLQIATSGGEDIVFKDGGLSGTRNLVIRGGNGGTEAYGSMRAPIFYDSNDTGYYLDPNSTSIINTLQFNGSVGTGQANLGVFLGNWNGAGYWGLGSNGTHTLRFDQVASYNSGGQSYLGATDVHLQLGPYYVVTYDRNANTGNLYATRYYDSNDTTYYCDPNSTSNLVAITTGATGTYNLFQSWTQLNGYHGFYSSLNGSHLYVNNGTYGSWRIAGSRNGWGGIEFDRTHQICLMINHNEVGFHNNSYGWMLEWYQGTLYTSTGTYGGSMAIVLHSSNYNSYSPTLTGGGASGTWGINITGNAATASNASQLGGWTVAQIVPYHSGSDFPNGTLVVTNINAAVTSGDSFVMEVTGKSYQTGNSPFGLLLQGYIYADTFINCSAMSYGTTFPNVVILNYSGNLAFWWPRISYWNSFSVTVREAGGSSYNRVTSISDSTEPSSTKKVTVSPFQVVHSGNIGSQSVNYASSAGNSDTVDGYHASGLWKLNEWNGNIYAHTDGRIYGTIFYDSNDSGYYLDPNSTSKLVQVNLGTTNTRLIADTAAGYVKIYGSASNYLAIGPYNNNGWAYQENVGNGNGTYYYVQSGRHAFHGGDLTPYADSGISLGTNSYRWTQIYTSGWLRQYGTQGMYNQDYGTHFYSSGTGSWNVTGSGGSVELVFRSNHQSTIRGYVYADTSNNIGFLNSAGNWSFKVDNSGNTFATNSSRAPIFYDSDNTGYYGDFANTGRSMYTAGYLQSDRMIMKGSSGGGQIYPTISYGGVSLYGGDQLTNGAYFTVTGIDYGSSPGAGSAEFVIRSTATSKFAMFSYDGSTWTGRYSLWGASGNVTIGSATTDYGYKLYVLGDIYATGNVTAYSDARVKTNIRPIDNVLDRVTKTRGVVYDRTDIESTDNIGFIAQELEEQFPELVSTGNDGMKGVMYQNMVAVLLEAIKEQQKQINELKAKLN